MERQLKPDWQDEADDFELSFKDQGCTCFLAPPCSYCLHPGNPLNLEETEEAWEEIEELEIGRIEGFSFTPSPPKPTYRASFVEYIKGISGLRFHNAHLRAKPLPKLKRCKKTGYIIHGTRSK